MDQLGVLLKMGEEERQQVEEENEQRVAEKEKETARATQRVRDLQTEIPLQLREIATAYPQDFSFRNDSPNGAVPGSFTFELVGITQTPERHLRVTLDPNSTFV